MMTRVLEFNRAPSMLSTYKRAVTNRTRVGDNVEIPRIEARVARIAFKRRAIEDYNTVCGLTGQGDRVAATYPNVLAGSLHGQLITHPDFPLPALGVVHVRQSIRYREPILIGDRLEVATWVEGHRDARAGIEFDLMTEFRRDGETVWEGCTTAIVRQKSKGGKKERATPPPGVSAGVDRSVTWRLGDDLGRRYAGVSGDYNPIHLYKPTARLFGFKRPIIHGMWTMARALGELDQQDMPAEFSIDFKAPVYLPSRVVFSSRPTESGAEFWVTSPDGSRTHALGKLAK